MLNLQRKIKFVIKWVTRSWYAVNQNKSNKTTGLAHFMSYKIGNNFIWRFQNIEKNSLYFYANKKRKKKKTMYDASFNSDRRNFKNYTTALKPGVNDRLYATRTNLISFIYLSTAGIFTYVPMRVCMYVCNLRECMNIYSLKVLILTCNFSIDIIIIIWTCKSGNVYQRYRIVWCIYFRNNCLGKEPNSALLSFPAKY